MPNKGEQMVRYYGFYSPAISRISRGKRKLQDKDDAIFSVGKGEKEEVNPVIFT